MKRPYKVAIGYSLSVRIKHEKIKSDRYSFISTRKHN